MGNCGTPRDPNQRTYFWMEYERQRVQMVVPTQRGSTAAEIIESARVNIANVNPRFNYTLHGVNWAGSRQERTNFALTDFVDVKLYRYLELRYHSLLSDA